MYSNIIQQKQKSIFMINSIFKKVFGTRNDRILKKYRSVVKKINSLEAGLIEFSDESLKNKTNEFKQRYASGESLDKILPEAFAVCREASRRVMGMRHFDVQLIGGMALHYGKIAEMRTGEGKTLMSTLPAYLNALTGDGVHIVTVNDYLAERDAKSMSKLFNFLGMSVGINLSNIPNKIKQDAYNADITYGTNNEYGFDYLRDNMVFNLQDKVQRKLNFAIVDEVDSILIDEARTPLIISGMAEDHTDLYRSINDIPSLLIRQIGEEKADGTGVEKAGDFLIDEKSHQVFLTEQGHEKAEEILSARGLIKEGDSLYAPHNITLMHHLYASLRAHNLYNKDQHYVIQDGEVVIVDEFTGRLMSGRRWSDGLHQAVEAKEGVDIQPENQTMASITFQNYFRMYGKLSGMTGTADTEAYEFNEIYNLETLIIPPNRIIIRKDAQDLIFKSNLEKYKAVLREIKQCFEKGQPVLVGTTSIENSEYVSQLLLKENIEHQVLNAKQHEKEAYIIAQAGKKGMITIATNMAGRGTDIVLGGNIEKQIDEIDSDYGLSDVEKTSHIKQLKANWQIESEQVKNLGGLHIIATERHESRRIDNQLRGRAGRQGDPGSSRFYLSLDDDLMRIFGGEKLQALFTRLKMPDNEPIEARMVSRSIESAQRKVEGRNFDVRKQLLQYDNVSNEQRKEIYAFRNETLSRKDLNELVSGLINDVIAEEVELYIPPNSLEEQWKVNELESSLGKEWHINLDLAKTIDLSNSITAQDILDMVTSKINTIYINKVELVGRETFSDFEKGILLSSIDQYWREHLANLEHLRQGIHLRGYAQKDPKQEYKKEAFELFSQMIKDIKYKVVQNIATVRIENESGQVANMDSTNDIDSIGLSNSLGLELQDQVKQKTMTMNVGEIPAVGRNEPCPCGSGQRYKNCHGKIV
jgi:preprotein translocase subunit SecA